MSPRFAHAGAFVRGSAAGSVLPCGKTATHQNRRRLLRVAAFECDLDVIPRWLRGEERDPGETGEVRR